MGGGTKHFPMLTAESEIYGVTVYMPKRKSYFPNFIRHDDAETRRSLARMCQLIEQYDEKLDAGAIYGGMNSYDMARALAYLIECRKKEEQRAAETVETIVLEDYELV